MPEAAITGPTLDPDEHDAVVVAWQIHSFVARGVQRSPATEPGAQRGYGEIIVPWQIPASPDSR